MPVHKKEIDSNFLEYFVGLVDGGGIFTVNSSINKVTFELHHF